MLGGMEVAAPSMSFDVQFDADLVRRYDGHGPRYTSYPTALQFHEGVDEGVYRRCIALSNEELIPRPLSLYVHLPFCASLCYYCGCTKKISRKPEHGEAYLDRLFTEIERQAAAFDPDRTCRQLHFGGGTPTWFADAQLDQLVDRLERDFRFATPAERSIEIDPRTVDPSRIASLRDMGFDRFSLGVQDFDPDVQRAVNRWQPVDETEALITAIRQDADARVSLDLIYGLPRQNQASFERTLDTVIALRPDRLATYAYAHLPQRFKAQRLIAEQDLPGPEERLGLLGLVIDRLTGAGYRYIGMDHFALPGDSLCEAQDNGTLQRNFQGYSTHRDCELVGLGVSAIGCVGPAYVQNHAHMPAWAEAVDRGELPIWRGVLLSAEDRLRRSLIDAIMCQGRVEFEPFEQRYGFDFHDHFAYEIEQLRTLELDGLVVLDDDRFEVTPAGRMLLRRVAMVFDAYLQRPETAPRHSRLI